MSSYEELRLDRKTNDRLCEACLSKHFNRWLSTEFSSSHGAQELLSRESGLRSRTFPLGQSIRLNKMRLKLTEKCLVGEQGFTSATQRCSLSPAYLRILQQAHKDSLGGEPHCLRQMGRLPWGMNFSEFVCSPRIQRCTISA